MERKMLLDNHALFDKTEVSRDTQQADFITKESVRWVLTRSGLWGDKLEDWD